MFRYIIYLLLGILSINSYSQCAGDIEFTLSQLPSDNNTYPPGTTVQLCVTMTGWPGTSIGSNWLEGFGLNLGNGWESVTPITFPEDCGGADPAYTWLFVNTVTSSATGNTAGPGFFYEGPSGPTDGDPGNDFGDYGTDCVWNFCVELTASNSPGADLSLFMDVYSDGDLGSWGNSNCVGVDPPIEITPPNTITEECGCTNSEACNFNINAICDDGSCILPDGCVDIDACNYNSDALCDDGSCIYPGCTSTNACNFDVNAGCDDGTCVYPGCNEPLACNFDPQAGCNDGTCSYFSIGDITHNLETCPDTTCINSSRVYVVSGSQLSVYSWYISDGGSLSQDLSSNCTVSWGNLPGSYEIGVYEITQAGCISDTVTCTIEIINPEIIFESESYTICLDETLPLSAIPRFGEWSSEYMNGSSFVGTTPGQFTVGYTGEIYDCSVTDFITVNVKPRFERPIVTSADTLIDLCEDPNKQFYSVESKDGVRYIWNIENVSSYSDVNSIVINWYDTTMNYLVSIYGIDTLDCQSDKAEFYVRTVACTRVYAPNSFTPDNDGVNDIFRVSGIGIYKPRLIIFDKWGNSFFETEDLYRGWNGDNGTGYYSENGVYNWIVYYRDAQGVARENTGFVYLIR